MSQPRIDVAAIGNAIVDVLAHVDDAFLARHGIAKGGMTLIDEFRARTLEKELPGATLAPGGSAANTTSGVAMLGGSARFIGRVKDDFLGQSFLSGLNAAGIHYSTPMSSTGSPTARCVIAITPDAQRSMNTYLGASVELDESVIVPEEIAAAAIFYIEGYLWDPPKAIAAIRKGMAAAKAANRKIALTLSDSFCVGRHRAAFLDLMASDLAILFANEAEIISLFETADFDGALQRVRAWSDATGGIAALTRSEKGSVVAGRSEVHVIDPIVQGKLVDTTGAGDLYAAGFLFGIAHGHDLAACGRLGSLCAGEVITHVGPRPQKDLKALARAHGLL